MDLRTLEFMFGEYMNMFVMFQQSDILSIRDKNSPL